MSNNKNKLKELNHYTLVNTCETFEELANAVSKIAENNDGWINEKADPVEAQSIINRCLLLPDYPVEEFPKDYGIRQQVIYILYNQKSDISKVTLGDIAAFIHHMV
jgi:hypothetical protein